MAAFSIVEHKYGVPIHVWAEKLDEKSLSQLKNVASLPFVFKHVAAMPDVHAGLGATIGSVIATDGAVIPSAVGVDIGCGMCLAKTNLKRDDLDGRAVRAIYNAILARIPVGLTERQPELVREDQTQAFEDGIASLLERRPHILSRMTRMTWRGQLGTLGGGNHFIELTADEAGVVRVMLHSGSRGAGNVMADWFIKTAKKVAAEKAIRLPDPALAYLEEGTETIWMPCIGRNTTPR